MKSYFTFFSLLAILIFSCNKENDHPNANPTENLALDSLIASKKHIVVWEQISVKAYARGQHHQNLQVIRLAVTASWRSAYEWLFNSIFFL